MTTTPEARISDALIGARSALAVLADILRRYANDNNIGADDPLLSINDMRKLLSIAHDSIEEQAS